MNKIKKDCRNCIYFPVNSVDYGNCQKINTSTDVRTQGFKLQVSATFGCKYFKNRDNGIVDNSSKN